MKNCAKATQLIKVTAGPERDNGTQKDGDRESTLETVFKGGKWSDKI